jgi:hypothetical protein
LKRIVSFPYANSTRPIEHTGIASQSRHSNKAKLGVRRSRLHPRNR